MVYSVTGQGFDKKAFIDGFNGNSGQPKPNDAGIFDKQSSIAYGRNSISNFNDYNQKELSKRDYNDPPAFNYEVKYLPEKNANRDNLNTMALMGQASEDMGGRTSIPVEELNKAYDSNPKAYGGKACADAYDINKDGKIDIAENAVSTLIKDMVDDQNPNDPQIDSKKIDGKFTKAGDENSSFMLAKNNVENNRNLAKQIYDKFNLGEAMNKFLGKTPETPAQKTPVPTAAPASTEKPVASTPVEKPAAPEIKFKLNNGQGLGSIVSQNKDQLAKQYGTTKLWGEGGLVDKFAKDNGFKGANDPALAKLQKNRDYSFKLGVPEEKAKEAPATVKTDLATKPQSSQKPEQVQQASKSEKVQTPKKDEYTPEQQKVIDSKIEHHISKQRGLIDSLKGWLVKSHQPNLMKDVAECEKLVNELQNNKQASVSDKLNKIKIINSKLSELVDRANPDQNQKKEPQPLPKLNGTEIPA